MTRSPRIAPALLVSVLVACSGADNGRGLRVGSEPGPLDAGGNASGTSGDPGGGAGGEVAPGSQALSAHVEDVDEMVIEVITVACAGECKQVRAVAQGGVAPYAFAWNDGVKTAEHEICASEDATFSVTVHDTPLQGEFPYAGQSVTASVMARVLACPEDGGVPSWDACLSNPSFESTAGEWVTPWQACATFVGAAVRAIDETADTGRPGVQFPRATDGQTYVTIVPSGPDFVIPGGLGQALCGGAIPPELEAAPLAFTFDARLIRNANATSNGDELKLEIYGGDAPCAAVETTPHPSPLWTSPPLSTTWTTYCASVDARTAGASLTFYAIAGPDSSIDSELLLDRIVFVDRCP